MAPITPSKRVADERGAALVEFALVLPLLLVVIAGIVDFGFVFQRYEVVTNAAREGARIAILPGYTEPVVKDRVRLYVKQGLSLSDGALNTVLPLTSVGVTYPNLDVPLSGGGTVTVPTALVTVNYQHEFLLLGPILSLINATWGDTITLQGNSRMRMEVVAVGS
jgi:Flp pilus assembly pilin Flp